MPDVFREVASQYPSRVAGSYLYSILPIVGQKLAALTSADELLLIDKSRLELVSQYHDDVPAPVACMTGCDSAEESIICAGRDGTVAIFDLRTRGRASHFKIGQPSPSLLDPAFQLE